MKRNNNNNNSRKNIIQFENPGRPEIAGPKMVGMVGMTIQKHGYDKRF